MKSLHDLQVEQKELLKGLEHPRLGNSLGLCEEFGEMMKEIMEIEIYREDRLEELSDECADVLFSLFSVCDSYEIDLESAYQRKIKKIGNKLPSWKEKYGKTLKTMRDKLD